VGNGRGEGADADVERGAERVGATVVPRGAAEATGLARTMPCFRVIHGHGWQTVCK
jgi:hypothetical protein